MTDVIVKIDDRVRLLSAVLALTRYPEVEQQLKPHGTHAHARSTRKVLGAFAEHPAVTGMQTALDQGVPLEALFTFGLALRWPAITAATLPRWAPAHWDDHLRDFYHTSGVAQWWHDDAHGWDEGLAHVTEVMSRFSFKPLFSSFLGAINEALMFIPNISYPTDRELSLRLGSYLILIVPPRLAWGDNPPWPYAEDPAHLYQAAINGYGRMLVLAYLRDHTDAVSEAAKTSLPVNDAFARRYPTWAEQFTTLFIAGAVALYLEEQLNKDEAAAYVLMERKTRHMDILPAVIHVLRRFLNETAGDKYQTLVDYLPVFAKQVRVAQRLIKR